MEKSLAGSRLWAGAEAFGEEPGWEQTLGGSCGPCRRAQARAMSRRELRSLERSTGGSRLCQGAVCP